MIGLVILFIAPFSIPSQGQVVATWTDGNGNWSNSANWSTLTVPNNGGGKTYDVVINGTGADTVIFDASSTINSLTLGSGETFQTTGSSQTLRAGGIANTGTINWGTGSLTIGGLSNDGTANIAGANLTIGGIGLGTLGEVSIGDCMGTIGGLFGGLASVLEIGGSSLTLGDSLFVQGSSVSIDSSALIVQGGLQSGGDFSRLHIGGSSIIMSGGLGNGFASIATIDNSTLIVGGIGTGDRSFTSIQNGSAVIAWNVGNLGTNFIVDRTSSLTVLGDFFNYEDGTAGIEGAFIVKGVLNNAWNHGRCMGRDDVKLMGVGILDFSNDQAAK